MTKFLWFIWRIFIPLFGIVIEGFCIYNIVDNWKAINDFPSKIMGTSGMVVAMIFVALIILLIEGQFYIVYRIMLPALMGTLAICLLFSLMLAFVDIASSEETRSELFGSMKFYGAMVYICILIILETLWVSLIFVIEKVPGVSVKCLIGGGGLLGMALVVTFIYWIIQMLIYFFAHYYLVFFTIFGSVMGGIYLIFIVVYCITNRKTLSEIIKDNLNKYWRYVK